MSGEHPPTVLPYPRSDIPPKPFAGEWNSLRLAVDSLVRS